MLKAKQNSFLKWFIGIVLLIVALCSFMTTAFAAGIPITCEDCRDSFYTSNLKEATTTTVAYGIDYIPGIGSQLWTNGTGQYWSVSADHEGDFPEGKGEKSLCAACVEKRVTAYKASLTLNATVPASLPIHVGEDGKVTTASNASIKNNGSKPIVISSINIAASSGWTVQSKVDATNAKAGSKVIAIGFNNSWVTPDSGNASGSINTSDFGKISASGTLNLAYDAVIPVAAAGGSSDETAATATIVVAFPEPPTLAAGSDWFPGSGWYNGCSVSRNTITKITLMDSYTPTGTEEEHWSADVNKSGDITCYRTGTEIIIAGNGAGKIRPNPNSEPVFSYSGPKFKSLISIENLELLDTSNVTDMTDMFSGCSGLTNLDLSKLDTSNVTNMTGIFSGCSGLTNLDLSKLDTSNVTNMSSMFYNCRGLTSLDVSKLDTSNVTNMSSMFYNCRGLTSLDVSKLDTSNVTDMSSMFYYCSGLTNLDLSNFDTSKATKMEYMFEECTKLTSLNLSNFNTSNVTNMSSLFSYCRGLTSLDISNFNTSKVTDMSNMFCYCQGLTRIDVSSFDTSNVAHMSGVFANCSGLTSLDISNFNTSNVTTMYALFEDCSKLTSLDVSKLDTSNVKNTDSMFGGCSGLTSLDISNFNTSKVTDMGSMFADCSGLTTIYAGDSWNTDKVTIGASMFNNCRKLPNYRNSKVDVTMATFTTNGGYLTRKVAAKSLKLNVDQSGTVNGYTEQSAA